MSAKVHAGGAHAPGKDPGPGGGVPEALRALSARIGRDPLQIQGPGGNTSIKAGGTLWVKASGTQLREAQERDIFVAVDRARALAELDGTGDGTCRAAMLDPASPIRPSIETTLHALFDHPVVLHTHSVATLAHATSEAGLRHAVAALAAAGIAAAVVPYAKPGIPLSRAVLEHAGPGADVVLLANHGLLVGARDVAAAEALLGAVESALAREPEREPDIADLWAHPPWRARAEAGSYWPDHVVFLGPALPPPGPRKGNGEGNGEGNARLMLQCLADVLARTPSDWTMRPIGPAAEAELMNWDAETYRQKLAARDA